MEDRLFDIEIFSGVDKKLLESLHKDCLIIEKSFKKDEIVLYQDDIYDDLYVLIDGICYSQMCDLSGKTIRIDDFHIGDCIGIGVIFSCNNRLPVSIIATSDCKFVVIKKKGILHLSKVSEYFLSFFLKKISDKITFLTKKVYSISFKTIKSKVASYIISKIKKETNYAIIDMTLEALSDYFGVARPSLSRVIGEMEKEGIIKREKNRYIILDEKRLYELNV